MSVSYASAPRRSAIPRVMGILMIIFGSLCLLSALSNLGGSSFDELRRMANSPEGQAGLLELQSAERILQIVGLIGVPISVLHLVAGIWCLQYKASAPRLALVYAGLAAVHTVAATLVTYAVLVPALDAMMSADAQTAAVATPVRSSLQLGLLIGVIAGLAWPVLVGVLMTRPTTRAVCTR